MAEPAYAGHHGSIYGDRRDPYIADKPRPAPVACGCGYGPSGTVAYRDEDVDGRSQWTCIRCGRRAG